MYPNFYQLTRELTQLMNKATIAMNELCQTNTTMWIDPLVTNPNSPAYNPYQSFIPVNQTQPATGIVRGIPRPTVAQPQQPNNLLLYSTIALIAILLLRK